MTIPDHKLEAFIATLPSSPFIIDCGANEGQWLSRIEHLLNGIPKILAVEMLEREAQRCRRNHPRTTVLNCAVGSSESDGIARRHACSQSSSLLHMAPMHDKVWDSMGHLPVGYERTDILTLDYLCKLICCPERVDLLKLDLQGYELEALKGAKQVLKRTQNVVCEVAWVELYEGQPLFADIDKFLIAAGFGFVEDFDIRLYEGEKAAGDGRWERV